MKCVNCKTQIKELKKNEQCDCQCGAKLLAVELKKELVVLDQKNYEGEIKNDDK